MVADAPTAVILPWSTSTVWSGTNLRASASKTCTFMKATGVVGVLTSDFASAGPRAAIAIDCASLSRTCSFAYCSGNQQRKNTKPKNFPLASDQIGMGELLTPVIAQAVTVCLLAPLPTSRVVSFSARAWPPGSSFMV